MHVEASLSIYLCPSLSLSAPVYLSLCRSLSLSIYPSLSLSVLSLSVNYASSGMYSAHSIRPLEPHQNRSPRHEML